MLDGEPLDPIEIDLTENPVELPTADLSDIEPLVGGIPPTVDEGDFYWHFAEQIDLHRVTTEYFVKLDEEADAEDVIDELTGEGGALANFEGTISPSGGGIVLTLSSGVSPVPDPEDVDEAATSVDGVDWTTPIFLGADSGGRVYLTEEIAVALEPEVDPEEFFGSSFSEWRRFFENQYIATVAAGGGLGALELANELVSNPDVEWASPNFSSDYRIATSDALYSNQWQMHNTGQTGAKSDSDSDFEEAWNTATGSSNVVIAVLDNGVQTNHPDLNIFVNSLETPGNSIDDDGNGFVDDVSEWNFVNNNNNANPVSNDDDHDDGSARLVDVELRGGNGG
jgi:hypothetical protein